jgi:CheY-like chemotaxis protein
VSDAGPGLDGVARGPVFDPFHGSHAASNGVALSSAYSIVRQHKGTVVVRACPSGTTFDVYLPASAAPAPRPAAAPSGPAEAALQGRVLVMDDQDAVRRTVARLLMAAGCEVLQAASGEEALALIRAEQAAGRKLATALLDLTVPGGMSGKALAPLVRMLDAEIVLVAMSGYFDDPVIARPDDYGFNDSLAKPMSYEDLVRKLGPILRPDRSG